MSRTYVSKKTGVKRVYRDKATPNWLFTDYRASAKYKSIPWGLTKEQFCALIEGVCHYCGQSPVARTHKNMVGELVCNGVDRKDSSLGYTPENVVSCCKICQFLKRGMPYDQFVAHLAKVGRFQLESQLLPPR